MPIVSGGLPHSYLVEEPILPSAALTSIRSLCTLEDPYLKNKLTDSLFVSAMKENIQWHLAHNRFYKNLVSISNFDMNALENMTDLHQIPFIPAVFFKTHETVSVPAESIILNLTSSGTSGQKSQMFFDDWSIHAPQRMVEAIFRWNGWVEQEQKINYLLYTYEVDRTSKLGTAYTDHFLSRFAPSDQVFTALRATGMGTHEFDLFGTIEKLKEFEKENQPVRIFGFPSFLYATIERMKALKLKPLKLRADSLVFLGGGWKGAQAQSIQSEKLYALVNEMLGIPLTRIRDGYGSVEHCIPYVECAEHQFHIPVWSEVIIRDVGNLKPLPFGEAGFLQFISPYITSVPAQSVLMDDLAVLQPGSKCPCGIQTPFFKILGRSSKGKNKSCALAAAELLKGNNI